MSIPYISSDDIEAHLAWSDITNAMEVGHTLPKASITDSFAYRKDDTLLTRTAWIDGLGSAVKSATVIPDNVSNGLPMIHGGMMLFDDTNGTLEAMIDFHMVTRWKTAGDSLLATQKLARADSEKILIIGAGTVARSMVHAYQSHFPKATFTLWNRTLNSAHKLADNIGNNAQVTVADDLQKAVQSADIICSATMSREPIIQGEWLQSGQHINLIGAFRPDMREADDTALTRSKIFVDSRETTLDHIGELKIPLQASAITRKDIVADYYDLQNGSFERKNSTDITLFKNGGGAHLDLMTAKAIWKKWRALRG